MQEEFKFIEETTTDPELKAFWRKNIECFNAPAIVYLTDIKVIVNGQFMI